ncbi:NAD(P)-binding protein [Myxococcota bacterium]|nr:NAD(P)-binding protein [Myxococcota bacterium]
MSPPIRVAVLGGGCAAMTVAYELSRPEHAGRYEITVYQEGWRLGGKGASGRGVYGRIEEHGLHVWLGWYENAFAMMRSAYRELGRDPARVPIATWRDAFFPAPHVGIAHKTDEGGWELWSAFFPPLPGEPGDLALAAETTTPESMTSLLRRGLAGFSRAFHYAYGLTAAGVPAETLDALVAHGEALARVAAPGPALAGAQLVALEGLVAALTSADSIAGESKIRTVAVDLIAAAQAILHTLREPPIRFPGALLPVIDLALTITRGVLAERLDQSPSGFDAIDDRDFAAWLKQHGASKRTTEGATVRGFYSLAFAFKDGDPSQPLASAGSAVRLLTRLLIGYRGSIFFKMRGGMGDIIFAPIYEVLARRGVRFELFHRVERVVPSKAPDASGKRHIEAIELSVQAKTRDGRPYQPLVDVRGVPSWPSEPLWDQLVDGEKLRASGIAFESPTERRVAGTKTLRVGADFDFAVLGVGPGAVPHVARELVATDPRWREAMAHLHTVATQALQLWLRPTTDELGWRRGPVTLSAFEHPLDTWAEMTHVLEWEDWPEGQGPRSVAYLCNVLDEKVIRAARPGEPGFEGRLTEHVRRGVVHYVNKNLPLLWPRAAAPGRGFDWSVLFDHREVANGGAGPADASALDAQYLRANVRPSERYVLCLPGTTRYRLSPLEESFDNLTVCGDWTANGIYKGCVEGAVLSGRLAAHALTRAPALESIPGYDGP